MTAIPEPERPLTDGVVALRAWRPGDADALNAAWMDEEIVRWTAVPGDGGVERARHWIAGWDARRCRGLSLDLVVTPADDPDVVAGEVGLVPRGGTAGIFEVGYWMGAQHRGRGWAARALRLLADWAEETLGTHVLVAVVDPRNPASAAVARGAGFAALPRSARGRRLIWSDPDR